MEDDDCRWLEKEEHAIKDLLGLENFSKQCLQSHSGPSVSKGNDLNKEQCGWELCCINERLEVTNCDGLRKRTKKNQRSPRSRGSSTTVKIAGRTYKRKPNPKPKSEYVFQHRKNMNDYIAEYRRGCSSLKKVHDDQGSDHCSPATATVVIDPYMPCKGDKE